MSASEQTGQHDTTITTILDASTQPDTQSILSKFRFDYIVLTRRQENRYKQQQQEMEKFYTKYEKVFQELVEASSKPNHVGDSKVASPLPQHLKEQTVSNTTLKPPKTKSLDSEDDDFIPIRPKPKKKKENPPPVKVEEEDFVFESFEEPPSATEKTKTSPSSDSSSAKRKAARAISPACHQHRIRHKRCPENCPHKPSYIEANLRRPDNNTPTITESVELSKKDTIVDSLQKAVEQKFMEAAFAQQMQTSTQVPISHDGVPVVFQAESVGNDAVQVKEDERVVHAVNCDSCGMTIEGLRYKCKQCEDFDLCTHCFSMRFALHKSDHQFWTMKKPVGSTKPPAGWEIRRDRTKQLCFYNPKTKAVSYEEPIQ